MEQDCKKGRGMHNPDSSMTKGQIVNHKRSLLAALVLLNIVVAGLFIVARGRAGPELTEADPVEPAANDGGAPIQRRRIDLFVEQVARMRDFNALAEGISDPVAGDFDIVFAAGGLTQDVEMQTQFLRVVADRRVSRLYEVMSGMSRKDAREQALALFENKLKRYEQGVVKAMDTRVAGDPQPVPIRLNYHALTSAYFLCSTFCEYAAIDDCLRKWNGCMDRIDTRIKADPQQLEIMRAELWTWGPPEKLFLVNCYVHCLDRKGALKEIELEKIPGFFHSAEYHVLDFKVVPYLKWDALTGPFDFTHIHRGVPIDDAKRMAKMHVAAGWGDLQGDAERQNRVLSYFRGMAAERNRE